MKSMETVPASFAENQSGVKSKTVTVIYWSLTILVALAMLMDGIAGVSQEKTGQEVMKHLGYPMYAMIIFGIAKILGAIALVQPKYRIIKEWAYAGFTINFIGAFASRVFVGDEIGLLIPPVVALGILLLSYYFWKRYLAERH